MMGEVIYLNKHMISRPVPSFIDGEIEQCRADLAKYGRCHMVGGKRVSPKDYGRRRENQ